MKYIFCFILNSAATVEINVDKDVLKSQGQANMNQL